MVKTIDVDKTIQAIVEYINECTQHNYPEFTQKYDIKNIIIKNAVIDGAIN